MRTKNTVRRALSPCFAVSLLASCVSGAFAANVNDLGTVGTQATSGGAVPVSKAAQVAPTRASLSATQPQSIISREYIENSTSPVADYSAIAAIAPSVTLGISTNGPGLGETKNGIRGFKDGEFNITFDGIPFGDTNGVSHHSTAYFPSSVIGEVVVERGPGNASNMGQATFGGSINMFSRPIANEQTVAPYLSFGSWNTQLYGLRYDSGVLKDAGDAKFAFSYQKQTSDGYLTFSPIQGENLMLKVEKAVGASTLLTANINYNRNWYYQSDVAKGLTAAQADLYGKNYMLSNDPTKANFYGYNKTEKSSSMNYLRIQSDLGSGWAIDNTFYYYNYTNHTLTSSASDVTTGLGKITLANGTQTGSTQMPGYRKLMEYAMTGDIFKATRQTDAGLARIGIWVERMKGDRNTYNYDVLTGAVNYDQAAVAGTALTGRNNAVYDMNLGWHIYQPFAEFEWAVNDRLTVTPGIKFVRHSLVLDALVNATTRLNQYVTKDFSATLPYLSANYKLTPEWATYAQYAKGMLVPNIGSYASTKADATDIDPQSSTNYQWGVIHKSDAWVFDADLYYIDFNNKIAAVPGTSGANVIYFNQGGVVYKGAEAELTYTFDNGLSAYGNLSLNRATTKDTGLTIAGVPDKTVAAGVLYKRNDWSASLIDKMVGRTNALDGGYKMGAYSSLDLNVSYTFRHPGFGAKSIKASLGVFNMLNHKDILSVSAKNSTVGSATFGTVNVGDIFTFQPERSVMASLKAEF